MSAAERALALDANLAEAHAVKARVLSQYGRHDEASAEIEIALRLDPESYEVNKSAAYLRVRQQRLDEAIRFYEKAMALMETDVNSPEHADHLLYAPSATPKARSAPRTSRSPAPRRSWRRTTNNGAAMGYGVDRARDASGRPSAPGNGSTARC